MYKGVTPTYTFKAPTDVDLSLASKIWVTFSTLGEREIFTKSGEDITIEDNKAKVFLSQKETLKFPEGEVKVQLNWLYPEGNKLKRACSNKFIINAEDNLKNEVLDVE